MASATTPSSKYGPMAYSLMENWGLRQTEDFGEVVFNLVEYGIFGKTETDNRQDFTEVYDFASTFKEPFEPQCTPVDTRDIASPDRP